MPQHAEALICQHTACPYNDNTPGSLRGDVSAVKSDVTAVKVSLATIQTTLDALAAVPYGRVAALESRVGIIDVWKIALTSTQAAYWKSALVVSAVVSTAIGFAFRYFHR